MAPGRGVKGKATALSAKEAGGRVRRPPGLRDDKAGADATSQVLDVAGALLLNGLRREEGASEARGRLCVDGQTCSLATQAETQTTGTDGRRAASGSEDAHICATLRAVPLRGAHAHVHAATRVDQSSLLHAATVQGVVGDLQGQALGGVHALHLRSREAEELVVEELDSIGEARMLAIGPGRIHGVAVVVWRIDGAVIPAHVGNLNDKVGA
mmetsp:Transcript_115107/g.245967  ORF Transcript_115107/g.245967 Transcript_115107/m.245967 type:complete len:212 (-) Transcript_115107:1012-1647(-)